VSCVGTITEIVPVIQVDNNVIGDGVPGAICKRLNKAYRDEINRNENYKR